jgi:hypothetical protein
LEFNRQAERKPFSLEEIGSPKLKQLEKKLWKQTRPRIRKRGRE